MHERTDAILYSSTGSFMIETKVSRSDFLADRKKPSRKDPSKGIGMYRYYACPEGLIKPEELPEKWGLIYVLPKNKRALMPVGYGGSINTGAPWPNSRLEYFGSKHLQELDWGDPLQPHTAFAFTERCMHLEYRYLYALATRLATDKFPANIIGKTAKPKKPEAPCLELAPCKCGFVSHSVLMMKHHQQTCKEFL